MDKDAVATGNKPAPRRMSSSTVHSYGHGYSRSVDSGHRHYVCSSRYSLFPTIKSATPEDEHGNTIFENAHLITSDIKANSGRTHSRSKSSSANLTSNKLQPKRQRSLSWFPPKRSTPPMASLVVAPSVPPSVEYVPQTAPVTSRSSGNRLLQMPPPRAKSVSVGRGDGNGNTCSAQGSASTPRAFSYLSTNGDEYELTCRANSYETSANDTVATETIGMAICISRRSSSVYSQDTDLDKCALAPTPSMQMPCAETAPVTQVESVAVAVAVTDTDAVANANPNTHVAHKAYNFASAGYAVSTAAAATPFFSSVAGAGAGPSTITASSTKGSRAAVSHPLSNNLSLSPRSPSFSPIPHSPPPQRPARPKYGLYERHQDPQSDSDSEYDEDLMYRECDESQRPDTGHTQGFKSHERSTWPTPKMPKADLHAHGGRSRVRHHQRLQHHHDAMPKDSPPTPPSSSSSSSSPPLPPLPLSIRSRPLLNAGPPTPPPKCPPTPPPKHHSNMTTTMSDSVRHLIQEADQAFDAMGPSLDDVNLGASYTLTSSSSPAANPTLLHSKPRTDIPITTPVTTASRSPSPSPPSASSAEQSHHNTMTRAPRPASESIKPSATKPQRKSTGKRSSAWHGTWHTKAMRWTLSENVADIISGQKFKRIEADEMLTPSQMEEMMEEIRRRRSREEARREEELLDATRSSSDSIRTGSTDKTDSTDEPFHLENLVNSLQPPNVNETRATDPHNPEVVHKDFSLWCDEPSSSEYSDDADEDDEKSDKVNLTQKPCPPPRNPARQSKRPEMKRLSTIPETLASSRTSRVPQSMHRMHTRSHSGDSVVCLESTPYTLTKPAFRHGPIVFQRRETSKGQQSLEEMDEALDWTAFQMAILGGAGELETGFEAEDEERYLTDDLVSWFDGFGFQSTGGLVKGKNPPRRSASHSPSSSTSSTSTINSDSELPIPLSSEPLLARWPTCDIPAPLDPMKFFSNKGSRKWAVDYPLRRGPTLVVGADVREGGVDESAAERMTEHAEMGCNLVSDLDEFLKWETQHAYSNTVM